MLTTFFLTATAAITGKTTPSRSSRAPGGSSSSVMDQPSDGPTDQPTDHPTGQADYRIACKPCMRLINYFVNRLTSVWQFRTRSDAKVQHLNFPVQKLSVIACCVCLCAGVLFLLSFRLQGEFFQVGDSIKTSNFDYAILRQTKISWCLWTT